MRKKNYYCCVLAVFAAIVLSVSMVSCGGDDSTPTTQTPSGDQGGGGGTEGGGGTGGGGGGTGSTAMSQQQQKEFLDATGRELLTMVPASDFQNISYLKKELERQDWRNVKNWANEIFNRTVQVLGETKNTETSGYDYYPSTSYYYIYNYINRDLRSAYEIANDKGHFELRNGAWVLVDPNTSDLQFTFTMNGATCVCKAETSGAIKRVHAYDTEKYKWVYNNNTYDPIKNAYTTVYDIYLDKEQHIIGIPENVTVTMTQDGNPVVKAILKTDLSGITNEEFDISTGNLDVVSTVVVNNYTINVSKVSYIHNAKASVSAEVMKGNTKLLTVAVASDLTGIPACNVSAFVNNHHFDGHIFDGSNAKNGVVKVDILGKVQVQGTVSDARGIVDKFNAAKENKYDETLFKANLADANRYADLGLYYNNYNVKQANVYLEAFKHTSWNGSAYWQADLVIKFGDESSYSICTNFFSERNFNDIINLLKSLGDDYVRLFK